MPTVRPTRRPFWGATRPLMAVVALAGLLLGGWATLVDPVRCWRRAIRDEASSTRRWGAAFQSISGRIDGLDADSAVAEFGGIVVDRSVGSPVRQTAATALGHFAHRALRQLPRLIAALRDPEPDVRVAATLAIRQVLGDRSADDPARCAAVIALTRSLDDPDGRVRCGSACTLAALGAGEGAVAGLIAALHDRNLDGQDRSRVLAALRRAGPGNRSAVPAVLATSTALHPDRVRADRPMGRAHLAEARFLRAVDHPDEAQAILRAAAEDVDLTVRAQAARELTQGGPGGQPPRP